MALHVLNDELKRLVVQTVNQYQSSFQPRPRRGRRPRGGGGDAGPTLQYGEVYSTVSAQASWTQPGIGMVQFKKDDGTDDGQPIEVRNLYKFSFANGDAVLCNRSYDPPRIVADKGESARALVKTTALIAAAVDGAGGRTPVSSTNYTQIVGTMTKPIENWSLTSIPANHYCVVEQINNKYIITSVFC